MSESRPTDPELLRPDHDVAAFDCGVPALDDWLRRRALANQAGGASRTFVSCAGGRVVGYYSLAAASILRDVATPRARRNMPDPVPAVVLGRLAVDVALRGTGLGGDLLQNAVLRTATAAESIGVRVLLVHALSDAARRFYIHFGFRESPVDPMTLMVTLDEIRAALA
ncbi:GNAT family N-acetyltransferase [Caulobacter sp. KR2-114]|uniref:GNAT family N-acetyltransferase n=1 Tax=Caulobacter sp. KR2-114 TaxID=3400912 RepID=UPI003C0D8C2F